MTLVQLRRLRWAARAVLTLAIAASITGNILHARPNLISQFISAWPPLAFLLTVELISRVPMHRKFLAASRLVATGGIAAIAAWVSYWHMTAVAARYGEAADSAHLLPLSVDGLIVVGSMCLVELAGQLRAAGERSEPVPVEESQGVPAVVEPDASPAPTVLPPSPDTGSIADEPERAPEPEPEGVPAASNSKRPALISDQRILARLRNTEAVPRRDDGTVPVRLVEDLFGVSQDRAVRVLTKAGLYRANGTEGVPAAEPAPVPVNGSEGAMA